jgi:hypothetical protein
MKSKISKILSVFVVLATIVSLLAAITALPVSAAAPSVPNFAQISSPSAIGNVLITGAAAGTTGVTNLVGTPDGSTLFAWASTTTTSYNLYKSTNFGATWAAPGAAGLALTAAPVALLISPKFATDSMIVFVTAANAFISNNAGVSFAAAPPPSLESGVITCADIGASYTTGAVTIAIGMSTASAGGQGVVSNVQTFQPNNNAYSWTELGGLSAGGIITNGTAGVCTGSPKTLVLGANTVTVTTLGDFAVTLPTGMSLTASGLGVSPTSLTASGTLTTTGAGALTVTLTSTTAGVGDLWVEGIKYSANYASDAELMVVANSGVGTTAAAPKLYSSFNGAAFAISNGCTLPGTATTKPTSAVIAMGTDYNGMSGVNTLAVGLNAGTNPGLYQVAARTSTATGTATNINTALNPTSIAITPAAIASATILVGSAGSASVTGYTAFTAAAPTAVATTRQPTGTGSPSCAVIWGGTKAFAGTVGRDGGISVSTDGAITFNQISLVNVGGVTTITGMSLASLEVADNNNMFLIMANGYGNSFAAQQLWVTADGGATWKRTMISSGTFTIASVKASPAFATDKTVFVSQGSSGVSSNVAKSTDGGNTFGLSITAALQSVIYPINGTNFYYGGTAVGTFYKYPNFPSATFPAGIATTVFSIAVNPKDATNIAVGMADCTVYMSTDSGTTFTKVGGAVGTTGTGGSFVAFGPDGSLYAEPANVDGVFYWSASAAAWFNIQALAAGGAGSGLAVGADGTLYAADKTATGHGIWRSLYPNLVNTVTGAATACGFQVMNAAAGSLFTGVDTTSTITGITVLSATAANTVYTLDTADTGLNYVAVGKILGFYDTFIGAPALSTPADKAQVTDQTSTAVTWAALSGATNYVVSVNPASDFSGTANGVTYAAGTLTATAGGAAPILVAGNTYYWKVKASSQVLGGLTANLDSRWSTVRSFVTTLPTVGSGAPATLLPLIGATNVPVDGTFSWPVPAGTITSYDFVIAEDQGTANHFAIIDFGDTTTINAYKLKEPLKYNTTYWWEVRADSGTATGAWTIGYFTTAPAPTSTTTTSTAAVTPTVIVTAPTQPPATYTIVNSGTTGTTTPVIPTYLLWLVIVVGAVLVIAVIVLIVRTRRIS